jgi:hypothetical protein
MRWQLPWRFRQPQLLDNVEVIAGGAQDMKHAVWTWEKTEP